MAKVQIKRGLQANVERLVLAEGELAVALDTGNVYIGTTSGTTIVNPKGGAADTALKLTNARTFALTGDAQAPAVNFDGSANVSLALTLAAMSGLAAGTYTKLTVDTKGRVTGATSIAVSDLPSLPSTKITGLGTAAALDIGTTAGKVVVVGADGKLPEGLLPALAVNDTYEAANQTAMLALAAQKGDICIRSDEGKSYILSSLPAATLANWKWLKTPDCKILSVNGRTGVVTLTAADVSAAPASHTNAAATAVALGHVKAGNGLIVDAGGVLSVGDIDGGTF